MPVVGAEVAQVLVAVPHRHFVEVADLLEDLGRRWFLCGSGRSGLVARMAAMRLTHVGFTAHVVGEMTTPAITRADGFMAFSATARDARDAPLCAADDPDAGAAMQARHANLQ